jgi:hypothetical protein
MREEEAGHCVSACFAASIVTRHSGAPRTARDIPMLKTPTMLPPALPTAPAGIQPWPANQLIMQA